MNIDLQVNEQLINEKMKTYLQYTSKGTDEAVNTKMFFIARNAVQETQMSTADKIRKALNVKVVPKNSTSGKEVRRAELIINARRKFSGKDPLEGKELKDKANRFIRSSAKSAGYLKSGWIPAIEYFKTKVPEKLASGKNYKRGKDKGGGQAMDQKGQLQDKSQASLWSSIRDRKKPKKVIKLLTEGLDKAVKRELASIEEYLAKKITDSQKVGLAKYNK